MLRIAHTADWHLGVTLHGGEARVHDFVNTAGEVVTAALANKADLLVIAGDLFDHPNVSVDVILAAKDVLQEAVDAGLPVVVVRGNATHDGRQLELLRAMFLAGDVLIFTRPEAAIVRTHHGDVYVAGIPAPTRSQFLSLGQNRSMSVPAANQAIARGCMNMVQGFSAEIPPGMPSVLLFHGAVSGLSLGGQHNLLEINEPVLGANEMEASAFDLVALGHIHKAQHINRKVYYAGSIERTDFGEEHDQKGFWLHDLDYGDDPGFRLMGSSWSGNGAREMTTVQIDGVNFTTAGVRDKIVRARLEVPPNHATTADPAAIAQQFYAAGAFHVVVAPPETRDDTLLQAAEATSDAVLRSPRDALKEYTDLVPPPDGIDVEALAALLEGGDGA